MEWLGDRHRGDLGTDLLGEEDGLLDRLRSEVRPISRHQDAFEHMASSFLCFFLTRRLAKNHASVVDRSNYAAWCHCPGFRGLASDIVRIFPFMQVRRSSFGMPSAHCAVRASAASASATATNMDRSPYLRLTKS